MRTRVTTLSLLGLALAMAVAACGESASEVAEPTLEERIVGSWSWIRAEGGIAGVVQTPESEGLTRELRLRADGLAQVHANGQLTTSTTYEFVPAEDLDDISIAARLRYAEPLLGGFEEQTVGFDTDGETLVLVDPCCDGFIWYWERIE